MEGFKWSDIEQNELLSYVESMFPSESHHLKTPYAVYGVTIGAISVSRTPQIGNSREEYLCSSP